MEKDRSKNKEETGKAKAIPDVPLYAGKDNPIPEGAVVGKLKTKDGAILRYARWKAKTSVSKGTVFFAAWAHGIH